MPLLGADAAVGQKNVAGYYAYLGTHFRPQVTIITGVQVPHGPLKQFLQALLSCKPSHNIISPISYTLVNRGRHAELSLIKDLL